jgi:hypothetical protein
MTTRKIVLIDGVNTVISNGYFIKDDIPRILADYKSKDYDIWLLSETYESSQEWNNSKCIPSWLQNSTILIDFDFVISNNDKFDKESIVITNRPKMFKNYNLKISSLETSIKPLNVADVIFCFGFTKLEFIKFCKNAKLIGVMNEKFFNKETSNPDGVAFMIDDKKSKNLEMESEFAIGCINKLIGDKIYTIQHRKKVIGITNNGLGIEGVDFNLESVKIPLLLV